MVRDKEKNKNRFISLIFFIFGVTKYFSASLTELFECVGIVRELLILLLCVLCDGGCALHAGLALLGDAGQQPLDLGNGAARVETLGTGLGAVHDGVTPEKYPMIN